MELTYEDVLAILNLLEGSNVEYLELDVGGTKLTVGKNGAALASREPAPPPPAASPTPAPLSSGATPGQGSAAPTTRVAPAATVPRVPAAASEDGLVTVKAPVVGVFYRAPEPGAPCYIEVGSYVVAGSTVGLVEVMKMFINVSSEVSGEVVDILAENDQFVEFGQPLIVIRPETTG